MRVSSIDNLWTVVDNSKQREKDIVCLDVKNDEIIKFIMPQDTIGVLLSGVSCSLDLYNCIVDLYNLYYDETNESHNKER